MYSPYVTFVLGSMVITGAARSIVAKLVYQLGFERPLFLTLLYLAGQALSLVPYNLWRCHVRRKGGDEADDDNGDVEASVGEDPDSCKSDDELTTSARDRIKSAALDSSLRFAKQLFTNKPDEERESFAEGGSSENADRSKLKNQDESGARTDEEPGGESRQPASKSSPSKAQDGNEDRPQQEQAMSAFYKESVPVGDEEQQRGQSNSENVGGARIISRPSVRTVPFSTAQRQRKSKNRRVKRSNSVSWHGLPEQSRTERLVSSVPWYAKPVVPALFNLLNSAMRWASLVFVAASVAEMLISGTELVLSVLATRCVRGRRVTRVRWIGVGVCTVGILMVGVFDLMNAGIAAGEDDGEVETSRRNQVIGILLIIGQSVMSVIQGESLDCSVQSNRTNTIVSAPNPARLFYYVLSTDLSEELFMHEADFPPALLVGMEGAFGLVLALIVYFPVAPLLGEHPSDTMDDFSDGKILAVSVGWTLLVTATGVFNITATGVTSSMTRNVWKNLRTCLVWVIGLIIFYSTGNPDLGEVRFLIICRDCEIRM